MHTIRVAHALGRQPSLPDTNTNTDTVVVHQIHLVAVDRGLGLTRLRA
ncbi:hypothetical protein QLQ12_45995 [Actinoplanes sp. NEAU-A12]|uniref:Uncharacterized protein n=1 Tax=Actinoplanes sandaracinus TaxID=3045177 RepID=A0ABT6X1P9_9ACTN|nr:hypothetical protein [Actinoplanes sandaracinus]MDI6105947.1 hypothetical protein [Actinoplanes sandaracinus]